MVRVGVTGGIGSGKTTVCRVWQELGAFVIYADDLAKKIMVEDVEVIKAIKGAFGDDAYNDDGTLNRPWLAKQAFTNNRVSELNAIVHPAVYRESDRLMREAERQGYPMAVREAAILLQHGRPSDLDKVVLLLADQTSRVDRVTKRDGSSQDQVYNRVAAQPNYEDYAPLADLVIRNDGSLSDLIENAEHAYWQLV